MAQLSFNFDSLLKAVEMTDIEAPKKRIRYAVPTYIKFYSLYQYNRDKFRKLMKEWLNTEEGKNRTYATLRKKQNEILELCYARDEYGNKLKDSDEQHIYRIRTLHKIYEQIYAYYIASFSLEKQGLRIDAEEKQAWLDIDDLKMSIKNRVIIHIRLLRLLRRGLSIKEAICRMKEN